MTHASTETGISSHFEQTFRCVRCNTTLPSGGDDEGPAPTHCANCLGVMDEQDPVGMRAACSGALAEIHGAERKAIEENRSRYDRCRTCQKKAAGRCPRCDAELADGAWDHCTRCGADAIEPVPLDECVTRSCDNYYLRISSTTKRDRARHLTIRYEETSRRIQQTDMCAEDVRW